jgi:hypothetical protein
MKWLNLRTIQKIGVSRVRKIKVIKQKTYPERKGEVEFLGLDPENKIEVWYWPTAKKYLYICSVCKEIMRFSSYNPGKQLQSLFCANAEYEGSEDGFCSEFGCSKIFDNSEKQIDQLLEPEKIQLRIH